MVARVTGPTPAGGVLDGEYPDPTFSAAGEAAIGDVLAATPAGGVLTGFYPNPSGFSPAGEAAIEALVPPLLPASDVLVLNVKATPFGILADAIGDGASHPASQRFATLAEAQLTFPAIRSLTEEIDGLAIQHCLSSLPARIGGIVFLPAGQYHSSKTLFWDHATIHLWGCGSASNSGGGTGITFPTNVSGIQFMGGSGGWAGKSGVHGIHITGTANTSDIGAHGILLSCARGQLHDVSVTGFAGNGVDILGSGGRTAPTAPTATPVVGGGGGEFATAKTWYYRLTVMTLGGANTHSDETVASAEVSVAVDANGSVQLSWPTYVAFGVESYKLYRSDTPGGQARTPALVATIPAGTTTYTDTGTATTPGFTVPVQGSMNANVCHLQNVQARSNRGWGIHAYGGSANVCFGTGLDVVLNFKGGLLEESSLGNTWEGHFAINGDASLNGGTVGADVRLTNTTRNNRIMVYTEDNSHLDAWALQIDVGCFNNEVDIRQYGLSTADGISSRVNNLATAANNVVQYWAKSTKLYTTQTIGNDQDGGVVGLVGSGSSAGVNIYNGKVLQLYNPGTTLAWIALHGSDGRLRFTQTAGNHFSTGNAFQADKGFVNSASLGQNRLYWGPGEPTTPGGVNPLVGDIYWRTNSPFGWRYCTVGGASPTWVDYATLIGGSASGADFDRQVFTTSGTWTKPAWVTSTSETTVAVFGGSGGGESGAVGAAGTVRRGGGPGGPGAAAVATFATSDLPATVNCTVGAAGVGGAASTGAANPGTSGGASFFGAAAGTALLGVTGGGGGGVSSAGAAGSAGSGMFASPAGTASSATGGNGPNGATSVNLAGSSGGAGGGITTGEVAGTGGTSGALISRPSASATAAGANGISQGVSSMLGGFGGGGGGASTTGNGVAGGNGGFPGGSGGGGGAAVTGFSSGAGGNGASGLIVVTTRGKV